MSRLLNVSPWLRASVICGLLVATASAQKNAADEPAVDGQLGTPQAKASYGIGRQIGRDLVQGGLEGDLLQLEALFLGIQDSVAGSESRVSQEEFQAAMTQVRELAQSAMGEKMKALAAKNQAEGPKFLQKYKAMEGVKALPSGLLYKVLKAGTGATPTKTDYVKTHYRGRLVDGTEFDSSYKRNEPAVFPVEGVIAGWTEALQKMKVGDRWQIVLPAELAYGENGSPPVIGPHAVLIFDLELLGIEKPEVPGATPGGEAAELPPQE